MKRFTVATLAMMVGTTIGSAGGTPAAGGAPANVEPNYRTACDLWPEIPYILTPVGVKDHLFRYNVFFNGIVLANPLHQKWAPQGAQLTIVPSSGGAPRRDWADLLKPDPALNQGWTDASAPTLWTTWSYPDAQFREEVFAYTAKDKDPVTGIEPLFAWVRLSVSERGKPSGPAVKRGVLIKINAPHISIDMTPTLGANIRLHPETSGYPRKLSLHPRADGEFRVVEEDGRVRLAIASAARCQLAWKPNESTTNDVVLAVEFPAGGRAAIDVFLPMIPMDAATVTKELALGYAACHKQADAYWSALPPTAAVINTPEEPINQLLRRNLQFAQVIAQYRPELNEYALLTGSLQYNAMWATANAQAIVFSLDTYGYHPAAQRYLEVFKKYQGQCWPPGGKLRPRPGYLGNPGHWHVVDWYSDHGAILYAIASHALLSGDPQFIHDWTDTIVKACEYTRDARRIRDLGGVAGLLPPAIATDEGRPMQAVWNDGWHYKGLVTAVRFLKKIHHPRAAEFAAEAADYRKAYGDALRQKTKQMPEWTDDRGAKHPILPDAITGREGDVTKGVFYQDAGPLFLVFAGLMKADDDLMRAALLWFREGPPAKAYVPNALLRDWAWACLPHEMSSCEPCYSWNLFHSHQLQDRARFLEGMYSLFAGDFSQRTYSMYESRGGVSGVTHVNLPAYLARLAVIDDQIEEGRLHLLRLVPLAWLRSDRETVFDNFPTEFGPVSLRFRLSRDKQTLNVSCKAQFRDPPEAVVLHVPPVAGLKRVRLNGRDVPWDGRQERVSVALARVLEETGGWGAPDTRSGPASVDGAGGRQHGQRASSGLRGGTRSPRAT